jgi:hypothetical protein
MENIVGNAPGFVFGFKDHYKNTKDHCESNGFRFCPMILEAHGGSWSLNMRRVLDFVGRHQEMCGESGRISASLKIAQRLSVSLQRENARAVLKRLGEPSGEEAGPVDLGSLWEDDGPDEVGEGPKGQ